MVLYCDDNKKQWSYMIPSNIFETKYRALFDAAQDPEDASDAYDNVKELLESSADQEYEMRSLSDEILVNWAPTEQQQELAASQRESREKSDTIRSFASAYGRGDSHVDWELCSHWKNVAEVYYFRAL